MKTPIEWFNDGILKLRQPRWNEWAYIEIFKADDGHILPWAKMYDVGCNGDSLGLWLFHNELFDPWFPPSDYEERKEEIYKSFKDE